MPTIVALTARDALQEPLPELLVAAKHTSSSSTPSAINVVAGLHPRPNFEAKVINTFNSQTWSQQIIDIKLTGPDAAHSTFEEHVAVFCEIDVKQRVFGRAGQVIGAVFKAQGQDLVFGSYTGVDRSRKPLDFIAIYQQSGSGIVRVVGQARLPSIQLHPLVSALDELEKRYEGSLRRFLGKVISYVNHQLAY
jgi:hypothetical protein